EPLWLKRCCLHILDSGHANGDSGRLCDGQGAPRLPPGAPRAAPRWPQKERKPKAKKVRFANGSRARVPPEPLPRLARVPLPPPPRPAVRVTRRRLTLAERVARAGIPEGAIALDSDGGEVDSDPGVAGAAAAAPPPPREAGPQAWPPWLQPPPELAGAGARSRSYVVDVCSLQVLRATFYWSDDKQMHMGASAQGTPITARPSTPSALQHSPARASAGRHRFEHIERFETAAVKRNSADLFEHLNADLTNTHGKTPGGDSRADERGERAPLLAARLLSGCAYLLNRYAG
ncbi:unnamed protein product, partial [Prorocentrum cordatum]